MKIIATRTYIQGQLNQAIDDDLSSQGYEAIDSFSAAGYTVFLRSIPHRRQMMAMGLPGYQIGLVRDDQTSFTEDDQLEKKKFRIPGGDVLKSIPSFVAKIKEWKQKYGLLMVGTHNESKLNKYMSLFKVFGISFQVKDYSQYGGPRQAMVI